MTEEEETGRKYHLPACASDAPPPPSPLMLPTREGWLDHNTVHSLWCTEHVASKHITFGCGDAFLLPIQLTDCYHSSSAMSRLVSTRCRTKPPASHLEEAPRCCVRASFPALMVPIVAEVMAPASRPLFPSSLAFFLGCCTSSRQNYHTRRQNRLSSSHQAHI